MSLRTILEAIGILICAVLLWFTLHQNKSEPFRNAETSPEVAGLPKEKIKPSSVDVLPTEAKKKLNLLKEQQDDASLYVLGSSKLPNDMHSQTVITLIDKDTGTVTSEVREDPYPWLASEANKTVSILYGIKNSGVKVGRIDIGADLIQVKAIHFTVNGSLDTDGAYFIGCGVAYHWR